MRLPCCGKFLIRAGELLNCEVSSVSVAADLRSVKIPDLDSSTLEQYRRALSPCEPVCLVTEAMAVGMRHERLREPSFRRFMHSAHLQGSFKA